MSSMIKNCPHNDYPSLCSRCSIERHAGSHRKLLNDIEQARVESAEQVVVEGLRAKELLDDEPSTPRAGERDEWRVMNFTKDGANEWMVVTGIGRTVALANTSDARQAEREMRQIATEHNQYATLIEQRERLVQLLRQFVSPTHCYCPVLAKSKKCGQCEARELLATIEREGEV